MRDDPVCPACYPYADKNWMRRIKPCAVMVQVGARLYCWDHGSELLDYLDAHMAEERRLESGAA